MLRYKIEILISDNSISRDSRKPRLITFLHTKMPSETVKVVCISDTHGRTDAEKFPQIPDGDILIHAGDISERGNVDHITKFNDWLGTLPHQYKIVIGGNHDKMLDDTLMETARTMKRKLTNCIYLESNAVYIKGIKFYGCPYTRNGGTQNHAFQMSTEELKSRWEKISRDVDILITHMPPFGILDLKSNDPEPVGCKHLLQAVTERINPKLHVFGHIHGSHGCQEIGTTMFVNASTVCGPVFNQPIIFEYKY